MKVLLILLALGLTRVYGFRTIIDKDGVPLCVCPRIYSPVCASNGKTYGNDCLVRCESDQLQSRGLRSLRILRHEACEEDPLLNKLGEIINEDDLEREIIGQNPIEY
ncbi:unnamed protein product [Ceutorhynchus assimilis]|uniref:Kazal-like domain-containing protein n=1 Tax=Ceutorhynchus assimilis TaxID=467358 RepID=A0A9N9MEH5_9CUCU|nr:unnamed protein product [Ceutorhynchus assimilis]